MPHAFYIHESLTFDYQAIPREVAAEDDEANEAPAPPASSRGPRASTDGSRDGDVAGGDRADTQDEARAVVVAK